MGSVMEQGYNGLDSQVSVQFPDNILSTAELVLAMSLDPERVFNSYLTINSQKEELAAKLNNISTRYIEMEERNKALQAQVDGLITVLSQVARPPTQPSTKESPKSAKRSFSKYIASDGSLTVGKLFSPDKHIQYEEPKYLHTMEDLGYSASTGVSPIAVSEPFRLFSEEAVNIMRAEILDPEVQEKYAYTSDIAPKQIRGYAPDHGKFIFEAWKHPQTLAIISKIAGVDLVPVMDYEIGHINLSVPSKKKQYDSKIMISEDDEQAIVGWHRDSYPFVCVLMMSDTTGMIGGETALRTGTGEIKKVRGPSKGCAVVLQGRYIDHQALRAFGGQERITMVTSFRPRSPGVRDDTVLTTVRPISDLSALYGQTVEYQLENADARIRQMLSYIRDCMKVGATDAKSIKSFLQFEIDQFSHLNKEIVDESMVKKGYIGEDCGAKRARTE